MVLRWAEACWKHFGAFETDKPLEAGWTEGYIFS